MYYMYSETESSCETGTASSWGENVKKISKVKQQSIEGVITDATSPDQTPEYRYMFIYKLPDPDPVC